MAHANRSRARDGRRALLQSCRRMGVRVVSPGVHACRVGAVRVNAPSAAATSCLAGVSTHCPPRAPHADSELRTRSLHSNVKPLGAVYVACTRPERAGKGRGGDGVMAPHASSASGATKMSNRASRLTVPQEECNAHLQCATEQRPTITCGMRATARRATQAERCAAPNVGAWCFNISVLTQLRSSNQAPGVCGSGSRRAGCEHANAARHREHANMRSGNVRKPCRRLACSAPASYCFFLPVAPWRTFLQ
jgi:hypothetical protein